MRRSKAIAATAIGALVLLSILSLRLLLRAGAFKTLRPHSDYTCKEMRDGFGVEDIALDTELGVAFISSLKDRRHAQRGVAGNGSIIAYSMGTPRFASVDLTPKNKYFDEQFHPQGFSFYRGEDGRKYLFVINRRTDTQTVELFEFNNMSLEHLDTFSDPELMTNPNNIVAVGPQQFYVSNYRVSTSTLGQQLEQILALPVSYVLYFDGTTFRKAAEGIRYANGVEASKDKKKIYISSTTGQSLEVYSRDEKTGDLKHESSVSLDTNPDNLYVDDDDNIWVGAIPKGLEFLKYRYERVDTCPSQVLRVAPDDLGSYEIEEVYLDTGEELSASTSAVPYKNRLLIGGVYEDYFLDCVMTPPPLASDPVVAKDRKPAAIDLPQDVENFFLSLAIHYADQDIETIMESVSDDFMLQGLDKNGFRQNLEQSYFFESIHEVEFSISRFEKRANLADLVGIVSTDFGVISPSMHLFPIHEGCMLRVENGEWKLFGDQQPRITGMFKEGLMIETVFDPQDMEMYRSLLPEILDMPDSPLVKMSIVHNRDVIDPLGPYKLGFIYILAEYEGLLGWHVLTMPEDAWVPVKHGNGWGYPKYVVDSIQFEKTSRGFFGAVIDGDDLLFSLDFTVDSSQASLVERMTSRKPLVLLRMALWDKESPVFTFSPYDEDAEASDKALLVTENQLAGVPADLYQEFGTVRISAGPNLPWKGMLPLGKPLKGKLQYFKGELNLERQMLKPASGREIGRTSIVDMID